MPIIRILTNLSDTEDRRLLARAGAHVFGSLGLRNEHITTIFTATSGADLFVAEKTFKELHGDEKFIVATVSMGSKRDADVRAELAIAYTHAVAGIVARHNVSVDFAVRDGGDVYVGGVALGTATTQLASISSDRGEASDLDARLRALLAKHWSVGSSAWDPSTPLAALRDDETEWDSLEGAVLAAVIETNLALALDLDIGEEAIRKAFGDDATYADLLALMERCTE